MNRVFTSTCLAMFCAAGLSAQSQSPDQRRADPARTDEKPVTIVGCLRAGDMPNTYVLANVKDESAARTSATDPNPTNPPSTPPAYPPATPPQDPSRVGTSGAADKEVKLIGAPASVDLSKHVGHTVAITGSWAPDSKANRPTGTTGTEPGMGAEKKSFNVKSLAHRSESCQ
jgi:hypothetical protein